MNRKRGEGEGKCQINKMIDNVKRMRTVKREKRGKRMGGNDEYGKCKERKGRKWEEWNKSSKEMEDVKYE